MGKVVEFDLLRLGWVEDEDEAEVEVRLDFLVGFFVRGFLTTVLGVGMTGEEGRR